MTEPNARQPAWMVDIDGTLSLRRDRSPYDFSRVGEDVPNLPVVIAVQAIAAHPAGAKIVAITAREESCRLQTALWLQAHEIPFDELLMRRTFDDRRDEEIKLEMYETLVAPRFKVVGVIDDRNRVVEMWRRIGLTCFQVASGDF